MELELDNQIKRAALNFGKTSYAQIACIVPAILVVAALWSFVGPVSLLAGASTYLFIAAAIEMAFAYGCRTGVRWARQYK